MRVMTKENEARGDPQDKSSSEMVLVCVYARKPKTNDNSCPSSTEPQNLTHVSEFLLLGLSDDWEWQPVLFGLFLSMYLVTVLGNLLIILAHGSDPHLHTPMYFFLCNLSLADLGFTFTTIPKLIVDIRTHNQLVAICHALHYMAIMNPCLCGLLVSVSFFTSLLVSQMHNSIVSQLTYFKDVEIAHFFCDPSQLLKFTCADTSTKNIVMYLVGAISGFLPISGILFSYYKIVSSVLRVPSAGGKHKAFSTCGSHLSVVCLFYSTGLGVYLNSAVSLSPRNDAVASVVYTVVTPVLNPFIYSLRNTDIKVAMWKPFSKRV
ncbi:Olfactory Receptor 7E24 [Manis pentadactyla]|nr:Olfactory Receptor 7E24 [Manis pentadactyla]